MPVKFGDIPKTATEVINDDYVSSYQLKTKVKTSWDGVIFSSQTDVMTSGAIQTPTKLTWKLPKPFGYPAICIDKLEMDKAGKLAFECSSDKFPVKGLKVVGKSDLKDLEKVSATCTYTGMKDTQIIVDTTPMKLMEKTDIEVTNTMGIATMGLKLSLANPTSPDFGVRLTQGPLFGALVVKSLLDAKKPTAYTGAGFYKVNDKLKVAATCSVADKTTYACGMLFDAMPGLKLRAKLDNTMTAHCSAKYELSKGFTLVGAGSYSNKGSKVGLQVSIE